MKSPSFQFFSADWLSGRSVRLMDAEQRGWYIQLLAESWESDPQGTLPNDDALLRVLAGVNTSSTDVERRWSFVKERFKKRGQLVYNERLMEEVVRQEINRQKKSEAGRASAEARRQQSEAIKAQHLTKVTPRNRRSAPVEQKGEQNVNTTSTESNLPIPTSVSVPITVSKKEKSIVAPASPDATSEEKILKSKTAQAVEIFEYWKKEHNRSGRTVFDSKRKGAVMARLADYPPDFIKQAIRGIKQSKMHMGDNERQEVYDDLELICRNSTNLEKFAALDVAKIPARASPTVCQNCHGTGVDTNYDFEKQEDVEIPCRMCHGEKAKAS